MPKDPPSSKRFKCKMCRKVFKSNHDLQTHLVDHPEVQYNFACSVPNCTKKCVTKHGLLVHTIRIHNARKTLNCPAAAGEQQQNCKETFSRKRDLVQHIKSCHPSLHLELQAQQFKCELCDFATGNRFYLRYHVALQHYRVKDRGSRGQDPVSKSTASSTPAKADLVQDFQEKYADLTITPVDTPQFTSDSTTPITSNLLIDAARSTEIDRATDTDYAQSKEMSVRPAQFLNPFPWPPALVRRNTEHLYPASDFSPKILPVRPIPLHPDENESGFFTFIRFVSNIQKYQHETLLLNNNSFTNEAENPIGWNSQPLEPNYHSSAHNQ